jgi:hypothetical protein
MGEACVEAPEARGSCAAGRGRQAARLVTKVTITIRKFKENETKWIAARTVDHVYPKLSRFCPPVQACTLNQPRE